MKRAVVAIVLFCLPGYTQDGGKVGELLAALETGNRRARQDAIDALANLNDARIEPALRKRLKVEKRFHTRLGLNYALASQGDVEGLGPLVQSLDRTGHFGVIYLARISGAHFGWCKDLWERWLSDLTPEGYRRSRERKLLPEAVVRGGADKFSAALRLLQDGKPFGVVADGMAAVAKEFPGSDAEYAARRLVPQFRALAREKPPEDDGWSRLLFRVRDVRVRQSSAEQGCYVLSKWNQLEGAPNAALELVARGAAAIPRLLRMLDDDRPSRTVNWHGRIFEHRDIAMQCLNALVAQPLFPEYSTHWTLSGERPSERKAVIAVMRRWDKEGRKNDEASRLWLKADLMGVHTALRALHTLATFYGRKQDVLKKLHDWYAARHWVYRPHYAELMAVLGDKSKVAEILKLHAENQYGKYSVWRPDDSAASMNAQEAAKRLAAGKPRRPGSVRWRDTGHGRR